MHWQRLALSKCLNAPILNAVPIREAIPVADLAQGLLDQADLALGDHLALVRVDQVVLGMMIVRRVAMIEALLAIGGRVVMIGLLVAMTGALVIGLLVEILVIGLLVAMTGVQMIVHHVATEQIPAQVLLGAHQVLVRVDQVVLGTMIVRHVVILVIVLLGVMTGVGLVIVLRVVSLVIVGRGGMTGVLMTGLRAVILVTGRRVGMTGVLMIVRHVVILGIVRRVVMTGVVLVTGLRAGMIGAQMIGLLVGTVLALVGRLVRAVMTAVMVGDEAVPVKRISLPASRVMRPSADVQRFAPVVLVPFVRT